MGPGRRLFVHVGVHIFISWFIATVRCTYLPNSEVCPETVTMFFVTEDDLPIPVQFSRFNSLFGVGFAAALLTRSSFSIPNTDGNSDNMGNAKTPLEYGYLRTGELIANKARGDFVVQGCSPLDFGTSIDILQIGACAGKSWNDPIFKFLVNQKTDEISAVLMEPVLTSFIDLQHNYRGSKARISFENFALVPSHELAAIGKTATMFAINSDAEGPGQIGWSGQIASMDPLHGRAHGFSTSDLQVLEVNATDWTSILQRHAQSSNSAAVGLLLLDTEGYDCRLVLDFPWQSVRPNIVVFEHVRISYS